MQADMDKMVHMWLKGMKLELLMKLDRKTYCKYIQVENKKGAVCWAEESSVWDDASYIVVLEASDLKIGSMGKSTHTTGVLQTKL